MTKHKLNMIVQVSNDLTMEINQFKYIPEYDEKVIIPEVMSLKEKKIELERLHKKYYPDCSGGCPSEIYINEAEQLIHLLEL